MKIGFFGGSFNPPTIAHLDLVKKAIQKSKLDDSDLQKIEDSIHLMRKRKNKN